MPSKIYADTFGNSNETDAITIDASGNTTLSGTANNIGAVTAGTIDGVTIGGTTPTSATFTDINGGQLAGMRNLIINGAMQVAQRGTQVTGVTSSGYRTCDRYFFVPFSLGTWTVDQSTDAPDGFRNSFKATCTTGDASPSAGAYVIIQQKIEAQNLQHLSYGTSSAKPMTLSFWVKSNKTGNASVELYQNDNSAESFPAQYTINSADTWERKTVYIPADDDGVIDNDNGVGIEVNFWLNSGSDYDSGSHPSEWQPYAVADRNASNLGVGGATSDYFAVTGVQLEVGSTATAFEHRPYGMELALCQRYYQIISFNDVVGSSSLNTMYYNSKPLPVTMRSSPTLEAGYALNSLSGNFITRVGTTNHNGVVLSSSTPHMISVRGSTTSIYNTITGDVHVKAEL